MWRPKRNSPRGRIRRPHSLQRDSFGVRFRRVLRRTAFGCCAVTFGVGIYFGALQVRHFVFQSDFFQIDRAKIAISGASPTLQKDARQRLAEVLPEYQGNLVRLDSAKLEAALAGLPRARTAHVSKTYPQGLRVSFVEREPLMVVNLDRPYLVDRDGKVLASAKPADIHALGLPVLTGVRTAKARAGDQLQQPRLGDILEAVQFIRGHDKAVDAQIAEWNISGMEEVTAILRGGASVRFGSAPPLELLDKLSAAIAQKPQILAQADYIDLRMDQQVVYNIKGQH